MNKMPDAERDIEGEAPESTQEPLSNPTINLAEKILAEVSFENRFIGYKLRERAGAIPVTAYSFEEVVNLLKDRLPLINLEALAKWLREVIGDEEIADNIAAVREQGKSDRECTLLVRDLAKTRLSQCKALMA